MPALTADDGSELDIDMFAEPEQAAIRRGDLEVDLESWAAADDRGEDASTRFGPIEGRALRNGYAEIESSDELPHRQELLDEYEPPGAPGPVPAPPGKGKPPTRQRQQLV